MTSSSLREHQVQQELHKTGKRKLQTRIKMAGFSPSPSFVWIILQMGFCVIGIYVCFGLWSIKQERVITKPYRSAGVGNDASESTEKLSSVFVLGFIQTIAATLVGSLLLLGEKLFFQSSSPEKNTPLPSSSPPAAAKSVVGTCDPGTLRLTLLMGFTNAFASSLGYSAMRRLPYPVVLATKMSKMVPVLVVGFLWHGTRYSLSKCLACALVTSGSLFFYLLEDAHKPQHQEMKSHARTVIKSWVGFIPLLLNLVADGFTNSTQDVFVKKRGWGGNRLMVFTNLSSGLWLALMLILLEVLHPLVTVYLSTEELFTAPSTLPFLLHLDATTRWLLREVVPFQDFSHTWDFFQKYPEALQDVAVMSLLNAVGQFFIFRTISLFGTMTLTALTLLRKSGSVLLSILVHDHHVAVGQWVALIFVFIGAVWEGLLHARKDRPLHK